MLEERDERTPCQQLDRDLGVRCSFLREGCPPGILQKRHFNERARVRVFSPLSPLRFIWCDLLVSRLSEHFMELCGKRSVRQLGVGNDEDVRGKKALTSNLVALSHELWSSCTRRASASHEDDSARPA